MHLVPEDVVHMLQRREVQKSTPELDAVVRVDREMEKILNNKELPLEQKVAMYNAALREYSAFRQQVHDLAPEHTYITASVPSPADSTDASVKQQPSADPAFVSSLPKSYQSKARKVVDYIQKSGRVAWNDRNEMVLDGKPVPNSNISDLVYDTVANNKSSNPQGWEAFTDVLRDIGVPEHLRANKRRKQEYAGAKKQKQTATAGELKKLPFADEPAETFWDAS